jgi:hypothetical protein
VLSDGFDVIKLKKKYIKKIFYYIFKKQIFLKSNTHHITKETQSHQQ